MKMFLVKSIKFLFSPLLYLILGLKILRARNLAKSYILSPQNYSTDKHAAQRYAKIYKIVRLLFFIKDFEVQVLNLERVPKVPVLFLGNHKSNLDALLIFKVIYENEKYPLISFIAKNELKDKYYGYLLDLIDVAFIDRKNPRQAMKILEVDAVNILKNNRSLCIFPEATRVVGHDFGEFQPGAIIPAYKSLSTVVPFAIHNSEGQLWDSTNDGRKFSKPKNRLVSINFGTAIKAPQFINLNYQQSIAIVRQQVKSLYVDITNLNQKKSNQTSVHDDIVNDVKKWFHKS